MSQGKTYKNSVEIGDKQYSKDIQSIIDNTGQISFDQ